MLAFITTALLQDCHPKQTKETATADTPTAADTSKLFLLTPYILSQVQEVDSTPIGILMITEKNGKTDSAYIPREQFHALANHFTEPDLNDNSLSRKYRENNYYDEAINKVVQDISTKDEDAVIRSAQIYLNRETRSVTSIYMEKGYTKGDTAITERLRWKTNRNFQIITIRYIGKKESVTNQRIIWDNRD